MDVHLSGLSCDVMSSGVTVRFGPCLYEAVWVVLVLTELHESSAAHRINILFSSSVSWCRHLQTTVRRFVDVGLFVWAEGLKQDGGSQTPTPSVFIHETKTSSSQSQMVQGIKWNQINSVSF